MSEYVVRLDSPEAADAERHRERAQGAEVEPVQRLVRAVVVHDAVDAGTGGAFSAPSRRYSTWCASNSAACGSRSRPRCAPLRKA